MFKINDYWRVTSNTQYSTTSNVPRFDKLNDTEEEICEFCGTGAPKFLYWYYGPQNRFFNSINLQGFQETKFFDRADFIVSYQKIQESRNQQKIDEDSLTIRKENVDVLSLNTNFKKGNFSYGSESIINFVESLSNLYEVSGDAVPVLGATRYPSGGSTLISNAIYLNYFKRFNEKLQIEAGVRSTVSSLRSTFADTISRIDLGIAGTSIKSNNHIFSGNIKITYYPNKNWKISSVTSKGFHSPNIDDMGKLFVKGDNLTIPNPSLAPEYAYSQEISISKEIGNNLLIYGTAFYTQIEDAIVKDSIWVNLNANPPAGSNPDPHWENHVIYEQEVKYTFANQNIGSAKIYGYTLGVEAKLLKNYKLYTDINFTHGEMDDDLGPLAHIPPVFGKLLIQRNIGKLQVALDLNYALAKSADDYDFAGVDNLDETPANITYNEFGDQITFYAGNPQWEVINLNCNYTINEKTSIQLSLNNLLDKHYKVFASGISAVGRSFVITLRVNG